MTVDFGKRNNRIYNIFKDLKELHLNYEKALKANFVFVLNQLLVSFFLLMHDRVGFSIDFDFPNKPEGHY